MARRLSFRATAAELGFAQSAISQHIITLENRVGARLVERSRGARTVRLTPAGEQLLSHVDAILARVKTADNEVAQRPLRVGVFQSVGSTVVPDALADFDLSAELVESEGDLDPLRTGTLDLTFTETRPRDGDIDFVELIEDPYMLLVPSADPRAANAHISLDALLSHIGEKGSEVKIFTIGYGDGADLAVLGKIAERARGTGARGTTSTIVEVFRDMAAFF